MKAKNNDVPYFDPSTDRIKFLGVTLKKTNDNSAGVRADCTLDRVIFHHKKYNAENFGLRVIIFEPGTENQYVEAFVLTPKASEHMYGHTLDDVEFDAIYFLKTVRKQLGFFDMPHLEAVKQMFDKINEVNQDSANV